VDPSLDTSAPRHARRSRRATPVPASQRTAARRDAHPAPRGAADRDRGTTLLFTFVTALLTMVGLICLVAIVDTTWFLILAVAVDLVITAGVLAMLFRLAADEDGS